jgi:tetratricopeptide (TPR) repeat protein
MVQTAFDPTQPPLNSPRLKVQIGSSQYDVGRENAVVVAHALLAAKKYHYAARICEVLLGWDSHDSCAAILLACCKAGLRDYAACNQLFKDVFEKSNLQLAEHLQAALVYQELGTRLDAVSELTAATNDAPDMAILWLLLGDEYAAIGNRDKATLCWRLAIDRDTRGGSVALAARCQIAHLLGRRPNSQSTTEDSLRDESSA